MTNIIDQTSSLAALQSSQAQTAEKVQNLKETARLKNDEALTEAARDFEAMFITEMMKPMFEELKPDPMFGGGKGEEVFFGMMLDEYGKIMSQTGQIGIADSIKQELIKLQEAKNVQEKPE